MNLKKILDSTNIKDAKHFDRVDYDFEEIYDFESSDKIAEWAADDAQLHYRVFADGDSVARIYKAIDGGIRAFVDTKVLEQLNDDVNHDNQFVESMSDYYGLTPNQFKKEWSKLYSNLNSIVKAKASKISKKCKLPFEENSNSKITTSTNSIKDSTKKGRGKTLADRVSDVIYQTYEGAETAKANVTIDGDTYKVWEEYGDFPMGGIYGPGYSKRWDSDSDDSEFVDREDLFEDFLEFVKSNYTEESEVIGYEVLA